MIFFYAEDEFYYTKEQKSVLTHEYGSGALIAFPTLEEIRAAVRSADVSTAFMAPYLPSSLDKIFEKSGFFEIVELKNRHGILTTGQHKLKIKEEDVLKEKLGINIHRPTVTLKDYGGADLLIEEAEKIAIKEMYGFPVKGFMITGMPGTGKSFFAKCLAGETDRLLVELNLSQLMEQDNTIYLINMIFDFFMRNSGRYIMWVDEIEKMIVGDKAMQVLGVMLTRINELNASSTSNLFFVATANNISGIAHSNPEFLRNGRFDVLVFVKPPKEADSEKIFDIYINKAIKTFENDVVFTMIKKALSGNFEKEGSRARAIQDSVIKSNLFCDDAFSDFQSNESAVSFIDGVKNDFRFSFSTNDFVRVALVEYREFAKDARFIYTPAEIEYIISDVFFGYYFFPNYLADIEEAEMESIYRKLAQKYKPLQATLSSSLTAMEGVAGSFIQI